ncbi:copper-binding protein [Rhodobacteraceae bacterium N5(2021)]|jgi:Cu/Ag efflux protein CusF|uniref:Copper-binding protein n=1 Tax=Gymnodinialimonas phycosphaerae TaxID=2841589 RepID=A0A975YG25_9RHOB|nr:copper-binding protein [Gymnodinialimonas phycosphaerae]MBY4891177.1 copper-binding protein [Gymnodinialimonas phycosphaerae]
MKTLKTAAFAAALGLIALPASAEGFVRGVVEEITTDPQRLTIAHDAIPNLEMEAMTMVFRVADPEMLDGLSVGQAIEFEAERVNGRLTVTALRDPS